MSEKLIEAVRQAIARAEYCQDVETCEFCAAPPEGDSCRSLARTAIAAIEASGTHRVVPVEPTEEMLLDGKVALIRFTMPEWGAKSICLFAYQNMLATAPKVIE